jgi:hypothetical protein
MSTIHATNVSELECLHSNMQINDKRQTTPFINGKKLEQATQKEYVYHLGARKGVHCLGAGTSRMRENTRKEGRRVNMVEILICKWK